MLKRLREHPRVLHLDCDAIVAVRIEMIGSLCAKQSSDCWNWAAVTTGKGVQHRQSDRYLIDHIMSDSTFVIESTGTRVSGSTRPARLETGGAACTVGTTRRGKTDGSARTCVGKSGTCGTRGARGEERERAAEAARRKRT